MLAKVIWFILTWTGMGIAANVLSMWALNMFHNEPMLKRNPRYFGLQTDEDIVSTAAMIFAWPAVIGATIGIGATKVLEDIVTLVRKQ